MKSYTFYIVNTVVDIGDGETGSVLNGELTGTINLGRMVESIMQHSYPMMVSVNTKMVDLSKDANASYYSLPAEWKYCKVSTFKFALEHDAVLDIDGIPLVVPCIVGDVRISKYNTSSALELINTSIEKRTF